MDLSKVEINCRSADDSFDVFQQIFDFSAAPNDDMQKFKMALEGHGNIRNKLYALVLDLADKLDEANWKHAEEMAMVKQEAADSVNTVTGKLGECHAFMKKLTTENRVERVMSNRMKVYLQTVSARKQTFAIYIDTISLSIRIESISNNPLLDTDVCMIRAFQF